MLKNKLLFKNVFQTCITMVTLINLKENEIYWKITKTFK